MWHGQFPRVSASRRVRRPRRSLTATTSFTMPGPMNAKRRRKLEQEKKKTRAKREALKDLQLNAESEVGREGVEDLNEDPCPSPTLSTSAISGALQRDKPLHSHSQSDLPDDASNLVLPHGRQTPFAPLSVSAILPNIPLDEVPAQLQNPFIVDPGNGPRVKDVDAFLASFFAPSPSLADPGCARYASPSVRDTFLKALPREVALVRKVNSLCITALIRRLRYLVDFVVQ